MEYSRNTLTMSLRHHEIEMLTETSKPAPSVQPICVAAWAVSGVLVGDFGSASSQSPGS